MNFYKKTNPINPVRNKFLSGANRVKYFLAFLAFSVLNFRIADLALSQGLGPAGLGKEQTEAFQGKSGFATVTESSVGEIVAVVIQAFLGLLGIIFLVLMITAGYKWMTASGNEEKMTEAKDTIFRAIIGLIITVSAYAITYFVFNSLDWFGGGGPPTPK